MYTYRDKSNRLTPWIVVTLTVMFTESHFLSNGEVLHVLPEHEISFRCFVFGRNCLEKREVQRQKCFWIPNKWFSNTLLELRAISIVLVLGRSPCHHVVHKQLRCWRLDYNNGKYAVDQFHSLAYALVIWFVLNGYRMMARWPHLYSLSSAPISGKAHSKGSSSQWTCKMTRNFLFLSVPVRRTANRTKTLTE